jgi:PAS domain S-box-containing protein
MRDDETSLPEAALEPRPDLAAPYESAPPHVFVDARRFAVVAFNAALARCVSAGYGVVLQPGMRAEDLLPPAAAAAWSGLFSRALREGFLHTDHAVAAGVVRRLVLNRLDRDGTAWGVSVFAVDASRRRQMQGALRTMRLQLQTLAEGTRDLAWSVDPHRCRLLTFNEAFAAHFERERQVVVAEGMIPEDLWPPEEAAHWRALCARALSAGWLVVEAPPFLSRGGTGLVALSRVESGGTVFAVSGLARDVSSRRAMERTLATGAAGLRTLFEDSPVPIAVTRQLRLEHVNDAYAAAFRAPRQSLVGQLLLEQWAPPSRGRVAALAQRLRSEAGPLECEAVGLRSDGAMCRMQVSMAALRRAPGELAVFLTDLSPPRGVDAQLDEAIEELRALEHRPAPEVAAPRRRAAAHPVLAGVLGESPAILAVLDQASMVAPTDSLVLITGETGTGKELLATAIHAMSPRAARPMVTVNCAALPAGLIESELFGREPGAFTGASSRQKGRFEAAHGSTLFLDEVAELPLEVQATLLRVLQDGRFERLGSARTISVDVRVIAATNHDLGTMVERGQFRADLFYRLRVFPVEMPPLRARPQDVPLLVRDAVRFFAGKLGKRIDSVPEQTMRQLQQYSWPGNVRELRNVIERAVILSRDGSLAVAPLPGAATNSPLTLAEAQRRHVAAVLESVGWRVGGGDGAAARLGVRRSTLHSIMKRLGIVRPKV